MFPPVITLVPCARDRTQVVLNSLRDRTHDDYIPKSLGFLRKGGRFMEIGSLVVKETRKLPNETQQSLGPWKDISILLTCASMIGQLGVWISKWCSFVCSIHMATMWTFGRYLSYMTFIWESQRTCELLRQALDLESRADATGASWCLDLILSSGHWDPLGIARLNRTDSPKKS